MFFMCCAGWSQHWLLYLLFMKEAGWRGLLMMHIFLSAPSLPLSLFICSTTKQIICFSCTEYCNYVCIMSTTPSANWHYCFFWIIFEIIYKETFSLAPPPSQSPTPALCWVFNMQIGHFCPEAIFFGRLLKYANASKENCKEEKGKTFIWAPGDFHSWNQMLSSCSRSCSGSVCFVSQGSV